MCKTSAYQRTKRKKEEKKHTDGQNKDSQQKKKTVTQKEKRTDRQLREIPSQSGILLLKYPI